MKQYIITHLFDDVLTTYYIGSVFVWCPCMAVDVSVQYNNGEFLSDTILLRPNIFTTTIIGEPV